MFFRCLGVHDFWALCMGSLSCTLPMVFTFLIFSNRQGGSSGISGVIFCSSLGAFEDTSMVHVIRR